MNPKLEKQREASRNYRDRHPSRYDYYPSPEAAAVIKQHRWRGKKVAVLDWLILKGAQALEKSQER